MSKQTVIRDAIHGDITLEPHEVELVDTQDFQRLRELKQLGMAQLVYPSATHTRFEHALGTLHIAEQVIERIQSRRKRKIDSELRSIIRLAALLHDIGQLPFGNTLEIDYQLVSSAHDQQDRLNEFLGSGTQLGELLDSLGYANQIRAVIGSAPRLDTGALETFARDVIVGPGISASFLDGSVRDACHVGITFAYDQRILNFLDVHPDTDHLFLQAVDKHRLRLDILSEVAGLLRNQHHLMEVVHGHRAKRAAEAMLARVFQASDLSEKEILHFGDYMLIESLQQSKCHEARIIMPLLQRRHLYKAVFEVSGRQAELEWQRDRLSQMFRSSSSERLKFEQMLERTFNLPRGAVIVSCPTTAVVSGLGQILIATREEAAPQSLEELADIPTAWEFRSLLERLRSLWSVLVFLHPSYLSVATEVAHLFEEHLNSQGIEVANELETRLARKIAEKYPAFTVSVRRKATRPEKRRGRSAEEISNLEDALDFALRLGDEKGEAAAHYELGLAYSELGAFAEAVAHFQRALGLAQTTDDKEAVANFSRELGVTYMGTGRLRDAVEMFHRSLEITQQFDDKRAEARALNNLGMAYANFKDYRKAIDYLQHALDVWRGLNDRTEMVNTLRRLGEIHTELQDYDAALRAYELCLAATGPSEPSQYVPTITEMSRLYAKQQRFEIAETLLRQAIQLIPPSELRQWAKELYGQLGFVLFSQSKKEEALAFLERAEKV